MSVQNVQIEIARAKLIFGLISLAVLAVLAGSCAPMQMQSANAEPAPTPGVSTTR